MPSVRLLACFGAFFLCAPLRSAVSQLEPAWTATPFPTGLGTGTSQRLAVDAGGGVLCVGIRDQVTLGILTAVRLDASGAHAWTTTIFPTAAIYKTRALALSPAGRLAVAGRKDQSPGVTPSATLLAVLEPNGALAWTQIGTTYGESTYDDVEFAPNGDVVVCGANGPAGIVRRFDALGNLVWESAPTNAYRFDALALDPSGDVVAVGSGNGYSANVVRFDGATGGVVWIRLVSYYSSDEPYDIVRGPGGELVVAGRFEVPTVPPFVDTFFGATQLDAQGNVTWVTGVPGLLSSSTGGLALTRDALGRNVLVGRSQDGTGTSRLRAAVLDGSGALVWTQAVDVPSLVWSYFEPNVGTDALGTIYSVATLRATTADEHGVVAVFDASGEQRFVWDPRTDDPVNFPRRLRDVVVRGTGEVNVLGENTAGRFWAARLGRTSTPYCFGDGSATACPCGNVSAVGSNAGCAHSFGYGARLVDAGTSSLTNDTFVLDGSAMPNASALYFQGTLDVSGGAGSVFGDGLRCAGGAVVRLATKLNVDGASRYPEAGDAPVSVRGLVPSAGSVRTYQVWFRNAAPFCTASTFNLSNGLRTTWTN